MEPDTTRPRFCLYKPCYGRALLRMYVDFEPKGVYEGLPPRDARRTANWLCELTGSPANSNFVLMQAHDAIGHAALVAYPHSPRSQEIIIFVHHAHQHRGLGRQLFLGALNWACLRLHLDEVWLMVGPGNSRARRLYQSVGFVADVREHVCDEITMRRPFRCARCIESRCPVFSSGLADDLAGQPLPG